MFTIFDGRSQFYQWDKDRQIKVDDPSITEVHFCNKTDSCSLVVEVKDGLANVPNILLQDNWRINVYAYDGQATKHSEVFNVVARSKPADYVYTETEIINYQTLLERMNSIDENIEQTITEYFQENPIDAAVISVNGKAGVVKLTAEDVGALPNTTVIPSTAGLATEDYVDNAVSNVKVDLTGYATEKYVDNAIANIDIPEGGEGKDEVYVGTSLPAGSEAVLWINPNETSSEELATKEYVDEAIANLDVDVDLTGYATEEFVTEAIEGIVIPDVSNFATEKYVDDAIAGIDIPEGGSAAADEITIITNEDGLLETSLGGYKVKNSDSVSVVSYTGDFTAESMNMYAKTPDTSIYTYSYFNKTANRVTHQLTVRVRENATGNTEELVLPMNFVKTESGFCYWKLKDNKYFRQAVFYSWNDKQIWLQVVDQLTFSDTYMIEYVDISTMPAYTYVPIEADFIPYSKTTMKKDADGNITPVLTNLKNGANSTGSTVYDYSLMGVDNNTVKGNGQFAWGQSSTISTTGYNCIAFGNWVEVVGGHSNIALGNSTIVGADYALAAGLSSWAHGEASMAMGKGVKTYGQGAFATGVNTEANLDGTATFGMNTVADSAYQMVTGYFNISDSSEEYAFIVGNGNSAGSENNAFSIAWNGDVTAAGVVTSSGADYAEYFEWLDGNPEDTDRVGLLVALEGAKIRLAQPEDDVLGVVSGTAMVLGDNAEWNWQGKYLKDDFGRIIYDMVDRFGTRNICDEFGNVIDTEQYLVGKFPQPRLNPNYDANQEYLKRSERAEWDAIGMMGKLYVKDDGSCVVGGYAAAGADGIATSATGKTNMRVMERVKPNIIRVLMK